MAHSAGGKEHHTPQEEDDLDDDPVERMLKKTGCLQKHYSVQVHFLVFF